MTTLFRMLAVFVLSSCFLVAGGCAPVRSLNSVPASLVDQAEIPGMPHVRTWGDSVDDRFIESLAQSLRQYHAYWAAHPEQKAPATSDVLAISGGADDGAFGAGVLCGWTARGDRPQFRLVTGISTGALIAPFAFLGPQYDAVLRANYTTIREKDVIQSRGLLALLNQDGLYNTHPLRHIISTWMSDQIIQAIAAEHAKGRRLLIGTVNLETQRPVIWDMGAIASSKDPKASDLFRTVVLASASIPGAFEPQYITVEAGGRSYEEMQVDGGSVAQVFLYGLGVDLNAVAKRSGIPEAKPPVRLFVIRNGRLYPEYQKMDPLFEPIAKRALSSLIKSQGIGDMFRLYLQAQKESMDFNLASITPDFPARADLVFDPKYMRAIFDFAYEKGKSGAVWRKTPPYFDMIDEPPSFSCPGTAPSLSPTASRRRGRRVQGRRIALG
jgi:predicted acylesterase/phospholipase RssA